MALNRLKYTGHYQYITNPDQLLRRTEKPTGYYQYNFDFNAEGVFLENILVITSTSPIRINCFAGQKNLLVITST